MYRMFVDESGDHNFNQLENPRHRYLGLIGCWMSIEANKHLHAALTQLKDRHFGPFDPDDPLILHREDMIRKRGPFVNLLDEQRCSKFDADLLELLKTTPLTVCAIVFDKKRLKESYNRPPHPYHFAVEMLLERYCGYLRYIGQTGDVLAEARGKIEDRLLCTEYEAIHERHLFGKPMSSNLTSKKLKMKTKEHNIAGLQIADLLGYSVREYILHTKGHVETMGAFTTKMMEVVKPKFNQNRYRGQVEGYGWKLFP